jgi:hypothetical protein
MKNIIRKTEEEMRQEAIFTPIKVKDYNPKYDYWECDIHKVLFEPDDTVLLKKIGDSDRIVCPLDVKDVRIIYRLGFFRKEHLTRRICGEGLMGADKAWYEARYKITPYR